MRSLSAMPADTSLIYSKSKAKPFITTNINAKIIEINLSFVLPYMSKYRSATTCVNLIE